MFVFVAALKQELAAFQHAVVIERREEIGGAPVADGHADGVAVTLVQSGMGRQRASRATRLAIERDRPDAIVSVGFSGGLSPEIRGADLVLGRRLLVAEPMEPGGEPVIGTDVITVDPSLLEASTIALEEGLLPVRSGDLVSVPQVLTGPQEKERLGRQSSALLVDMESYWVAHTAREAGVPFLAARVASDEVGDTLPDFARFVDEMGNVRLMPALWYFLTHPQHMLATPVLASNARAGARNLASFGALFLTMVYKGVAVGR
ncbi:MAG: hypothetical protein V3V35_08265 [Dehalococcoidia bacterium]